MEISLDSLILVLVLVVVWWYTKHNCTTTQTIPETPRVSWLSILCVQEHSLQSFERTSCCVFSCKFQLIFLLLS